MDFRLDSRVVGLRASSAGSAPLCRRRISARTCSPCSTSSAPRTCRSRVRASVAPRAGVRGGTSSGRHAQTYDTRVQSKIHSLANLAAARATCRLAAAARRSQARRGAQPTQDRGNDLSASFYTLTHDTDSYRPAAIPARGRKYGLVGSMRVAFPFIMQTFRLQLHIFRSGSVRCLLRSRFLGAVGRRGRGGAGVPHYLREGA